MARTSGSRAAPSSGFENCSAATCSSSQNFNTSENLCLLYRGVCRDTASLGTEDTLSFAVLEPDPPAWPWLSNQKPQGVQIYLALTWCCLILSGWNVNICCHHDRTFRVGAVSMRTPAEVVSASLEAVVRREVLQYGPSLCEVASRCETCPANNRRSGRERKRAGRDRTSDRFNCQCDDAYARRH